MSYNKTRYNFEIGNIDDNVYIILERIIDNFMYIET